MASTITGMSTPPTTEASMTPSPTSGSSRLPWRMSNKREASSHRLSVV